MNLLLAQILILVLIILISALSKCNGSKIYYDCETCSNHCDRRCYERNCGINCAVNDNCRTDCNFNSHDAVDIISNTKNSLPEMFHTYGRRVPHRLLERDLYHQQRDIDESLVNHLKHRTSRTIPVTKICEDCLKVKNKSLKRELIKTGLKKIYKRYKNKNCKDCYIGHK